MDVRTAALVLMHCEHPDLLVNAKEFSRGGLDR